MLDNRFLNHATRVVDMGYPVFPIRANGKEPYAKGGFHNASRDFNQILEWAEQYPNANVGVPTGAVSGITVVDVDGEEGVESMKGAFPQGAISTRTHMTPRGKGWHLIYQYNPLIRNVNGALYKVDLKNDGGYVIWEGSHFDGEKYSGDWKVLKDIEIVPIKDIPEEFLVTYKKPTSPSQSTEPSEDWLGDALKGVSEGTRDSTAVRIIGKLHRDNYSRESIVAILEGYASKCSPQWVPDEGTIGDKVDYIMSQYPKENSRVNQLKEDIKVWTPVIVDMSTVEPEEVNWRWEGRLPMGKLSIIEGDPEAGKSFLTLAIASAISNGDPLPPETDRFTPKDVLILSAEDGIEDTLAPRLIGMGANMGRIKVLKSMRDNEGAIRVPNLQTDIDVLDNELQNADYGLIVIDPLNAYTPTVDSKTDASVRSMLHPIADLAERNNVIVLVVRHLTKNENSKAQYRGLGSIGYLAQARVVMLVGKNPDNEDERVVVVSKTNLAVRSLGIAYDMKDGIFQWKGESDITIDQLLSRPTTQDEKSQVDECLEWLYDLLQSNGGNHPSSEVIRRGNGEGYSTSTIKRAKAKAPDIVKKKIGFNEASQWYFEIMRDESKRVTQKAEPLRIERDDWEVI